MTVKLSALTIFVIIGSASCTSPSVSALSNEHIPHTLTQEQNERLQKAERIKKIGMCAAYTVLGSGIAYICYTCGTTFRHFLKNEEEFLQQHIQQLAEEYMQPYDEQCKNEMLQVQHDVAEQLASNNRIFETLNTQLKTVSDEQTIEQTQICSQIEAHCQIQIDLLAAYQDRSKKLVDERESHYTDALEYAYAKIREEQEKK